MSQPIIRATAVFAASSAVLAAAPTHAAVVVYAQNLAGFNAAAGNPPIAVDFDAIVPGTDIGGLSFSGAEFTALGAPLIVVRGIDTYTPAGFSGAPNPQLNKLPATTGENVLSPGGVVLGPGPNPPIEEDDLRITFAEPVAAFGFDHLSQSADGFSFTTIRVYDANNVQLYAGTVPISNLGGGGAPAGADFWGIVSTNADIKRIDIDEGDNNSQYPDCNIGFDTLRFVPIGPQVCLGDADCDGDVDFFDIDPFVAKLGCPGAGTDCGAPCPWQNADADQDGDVDFFDIDPFVALLGTSCP